MRNYNLITRNHVRVLSLLASIIFQFSAGYSQNVGIGTSTPHATAIFQLDATNRGILIPRLTTAQRNLIVGPAAGLLVYDTNVQGFVYWTGASWQSIPNASSVWLLSGNTGTNPIVQFIGTTDANDLQVRLNNIARLIFRQNGAIWTKINNSDTFFGDSTSGGIGYSGNSNTFIGFKTGKGIITGANNSFLGANSGFNSQPAVTENSFFGSFSGYSNIGINNTYMGAYAGYSTGGNDNSFFGRNCGRENSTGSRNSFFGESAGYSNSGRDNSYFGQTAGRDNLTGVENSFFGAGAGMSADQGMQNCFFGYESGLDAQGSSNSFFGHHSGGANSGNNNCFFGVSAGFLNTSDVSGNSFFGAFSGNAVLPGSNLTLIGSNASFSGFNISNSTALGSNVSVTASNQVRIGNASITSIGGQVGWTVLSDGRFKKNILEDIPGLEFVLQLRPVTYQFDIRSIEKKIHSKNDVPDQNETSIATAESIRYTGFIAQEVEELAKKMKFNFSGLDVPKNENDFYGLRYAEFVVPLVKAVQEQQKMINEQAELIKKMLEEIREIKGRL